MRKSYQENDYIQGIVVDRIEVKLETFADDVTAFLKTDRSLKHILDVISHFGNRDDRWKNSECNRLRDPNVKAWLYFTHPWP